MHSKRNGKPTARHKRRFCLFGRFGSRYTPKPFRKSRLRFERRTAQTQFRSVYNEQSRNDNLGALPFCWAWVRPLHKPRRRQKHRLLSRTWASLAKVYVHKPHTNRQQSTRTETAWKSKRYFLLEAWQKRTFGNRTYCRLKPQRLNRLQSVGGFLLRETPFTLLHRTQHYVAKLSLYFCTKPH